MQGWKEQISGIIAETERNLGGRGHVARNHKPLYKAPLNVSDSVSAGFQAPLFPPKEAVPEPSVNLENAFRGLQPGDGRSSQQRLLESVKCAVIYS